MELNHNLLNVLGVSHPSIEKIRKIATSHGHQAKLTGSGGGGIVLVLANPSKSIRSFQEECSDHGFRTYPVQLGGQGIKYESISF